MSGLEQSRTPHLRAGVIAAVATLVLDQASKLWLLYVFDLGNRGAVRVTPFFDLVLAWNVGISFGWFQTDNQLAQVALMAIKAVAVVVLGIWMARSSTLLATLALGLIIGGADGGRSHHEADTEGNGSIPQRPAQRACLQHPEAGFDLAHRAVPIHNFCNTRGPV